MKEFVYQLQCVIAFILGHAAPPDRPDMKALIADARRQVEAECAEEDRLFDEYRMLDRPKIKKMMRDTECDPLEEREMVDLDDFNRWRAQRGT